MTSSVMLRLRSSSSTDGAGRLEDDDEVGALALAGDGVRETAAAPGADLDDLAVGRGDAAGGAVEDLLDAVIGGIRPQDQHELVTTHDGYRLLPMGSAPLARIRGVDASAAGLKGRTEG